MRRFISFCSLIATLALFTMFVSPIASAAPASSTRQVATAHPSTCTPGSYNWVSGINIHDLAKGTLIGTMDLYVDGCGWLQARAWAFYGGVINHLELYNYDSGALLFAAPTNGSDDVETIHLKANGACVYATGVVQNLPNKWWGKNSTSGCYTGY